MNWFPLKNYTHYSLLRGFSKPEDLVKKCKDNAYIACGIADYKTISGCISFFKACKKEGIKPILGCSFDGFQLFAKNKNGWHDLIELVSLLDENSNLSEDNLKDILNRKNLIKIQEDFEPASYYVNKEDASLHRILLCSEMKTTLPKIKKSLIKGLDGDIIIDYNKYPEEHADKADFFLSDSYYVKDKHESKDFDTKISKLVYEQCEQYDILHNPMLPKFKCPNNLSEEDYLKELCRTGWKERLIKANKVSDENSKELYLKRFKEEFDVIKDADLFGYFLIVQDILRYVRENGWMTGPGRGSAGGCLISYLIGITQVDPIEFDLLFERFYSAGRNVKESISFPEFSLEEFQSRV